MLILQWRIPIYGPRAGVVFIWVFIALIVGVPNAVHRNSEEPYYGPTGYCKPRYASFYGLFQADYVINTGCWINPYYRNAQLSTEYVWMWVSAFTMAILYGIMFLVMRGFITGDKHGLHWAKRNNSVENNRPSPGHSMIDREDEKMARMMLL